MGQSHFKTFDNKFFTFTGHCQYLLARDCTDREFSVIIDNVQVMDICLLGSFSCLAHKLHKLLLRHQLITIYSVLAVDVHFSVQMMRMLCAHVQWRSPCPLWKTWQWSWSTEESSLSTAWTSKPQCIMVCHFGIYCPTKHILSFLRRPCKHFCSFENVMYIKWCWIPLVSFLGVLFKGRLHIQRSVQSSVHVKFGDDLRLDWDGRGRVLLKVKYT